jgi:type III restriction enzyme
MELKEYQRQTLNRLKRYLDAIEECAAKERKLKQEKIDIPYNVLEHAWELATEKKNYQPRKNGLGESIPQVCLKVPTGGGKTLLATLAIDLIKTYYLKRASTLVLWIVPSEAIYRQTLNALRNREHPYRQSLDRASGGRTLILEKTDRFTPMQLQEHLIVMLLMLPSANRKSKESLKVFQDTSGFEDFFPPEDDLMANRDLINDIANLTCYGDSGSIITSLGNTLRLLKPLMIIDEGHKTYSSTAQETIRSLNPCFILELSATPSDASNVLYTVSGRDLNREQMIKLDLNIINMPNLDWKDPLAAVIQKLDMLQLTAQKYKENGGKYIRPICLIQAERTGKDQQGGRFIHAKEVEVELVKRGIDPSAIAIKSSENDGLEDVDLLSEECPIRFIITKQALQEGWDCPFAYILAVLNNPSSQTAITQLVGRVLRQPYAKKTDVRELDESYVYCFRHKASELLDAVRRGFDEEGLSDLSHRAFLYEDDTSLVDVHLRPEFQKFAGKIYLPRFVFKENDETRLLSYEMDILSRIDWSQVDIDKLSSTPSFFSQYVYSAKVNTSERGVEIIKQTGGESQPVELPIDPTFVAMQLTDIVPNPWMAYDIAKRTIDLMVRRHGRDRVGTDLGLIITDLKLLLERERDELARAIFHQLVQQKKLLFVLNIEHGYLLPDSIRVRMGNNSRKLARENNDLIQRSLFEFVPEDELNKEEQDVAVHLDKQEQFILWWDRNFARGYGYSYYVQGWGRDRIYPDFLVGKRDKKDTDDYVEILVLETKGRHLDNADTAYKKSVFQLCNELVKEWDSGFGDDETLKQVEFHLVFHDEAISQINSILQKS